MNSRGFTMVELLVVVAIIAILSAIGITVFSSAQVQSRDSKRKADIESIAQVLEVNRGSGVYTTLAVESFNSGALPFDPKTSSVTIKTVTGCGSGTNTDKCWYCFKKSGSGVGPCHTTDDYSINVSMTNSSYTYLQTGWIVCANLESGSFFCRKNSQ